MACGSGYTCGFGIVAASPSRSVKSESVLQGKTLRNAAKPSAEAHDRVVCRNPVQWLRGIAPMSCVLSGKIKPHGGLPCKKLINTKIAVVVVSVCLILCYK